MQNISKEGRNKIKEKIERSIEEGNVEQLIKLVTTSASWLNHDKKFSLLELFMMNYILNKNLSKEKIQKGIEVCHAIVGLSNSPDIKVIESIDLSNDDPISRELLRTLAKRFPQAVKESINTKMKSYINASSFSSPESFTKKFILVRESLDFSDKSAFDKQVKELYQIKEMTYSKEKIDFLNEQGGLINQLTVFCLESFIKLSAKLHNYSRNYIRIFRDNNVSLKNDTVENITTDFLNNQMLERDFRLENKVKKTTPTSLATPKDVPSQQKKTTESNLAKSSVAILNPSTQKLNPQEFDPEVAFFIEQREANNFRNWTIKNTNESLNIKDKNGFSLIGVFIKSHLPESVKNPLGQKEIEKGLQILEVLIVDRKISCTKKDLDSVDVKDSGPLSRKLVELLMERQPQQFLSYIETKLKGFAEPEPLFIEFEKNFALVKAVLDQKNPEMFTKMVDASLDLARKNREAKEAEVNNLNTLKEIIHTETREPQSSSISLQEKNRALVKALGQKLHLPADHSAPHVLPKSRKSNPEVKK